MNHDSSLEITFELLMAACMCVIELLQMGAAPLANGAGGGRHWSAEHDAAPACQKAVRPAVVPPQSQSQAPSLKKPRVESRSSTVVPSFKVMHARLLTSMADVFLVLMARLLESMQPY